MSGTLPTVMTTQGLQPQAPSSLRSQLLTAVAITNPGYTANLPGSLIEDLASTSVAAISQMDSARVELVNSLTPYGANLFILNQLGQIYGVQRNVDSNTSVNVIFSGTPGFPIIAGFLVSDGTHQYTVQSQVIIPASGTTGLVYCVALLAGSWPVPPNAVTALATSVPTGITLAVTNPQAGTPATGADTDEQYRANVLQAGLASATGMPRLMKNALQAVNGVQPRLVSVIQSGTSWKVIVGGGDPYAVANAIFLSLFDINSLIGSTINVVAASKAAAAVITTDLNHNLSTGSTAVISGATGMTGINGSWTITALTPTTFSIPYNSTSAATYTGGGVLMTNARNQSVTINDYPNTYVIPFVLPPVENVAISLTWNTTSTNSVSATSMAILGAQGISDYINSIPVGAPMNLFELQNAFQTATASVLQTGLLTRMIFGVYINGVLTAPSTGTGVIAGDPESYFLTSVPSITITQG